MGPALVVLTRVSSPEVYQDTRNLLDENGGLRTLAGGHRYFAVVHVEAGGARPSPEVCAIPEPSTHGMAARGPLTSDRVGVRSFRKI